MQSFTTIYVGGIFACASVAVSMRAQTQRTLDWNTAQEVTERTCNAAELSFVRSPEQTERERSYNLVPGVFGEGEYEWTCTALSSAAYSGASVIRVFRPNFYDDGKGFTLVRAHGSPNTYLVVLIGGDHRPWQYIDHTNASAAFNSILATQSVNSQQEPDWLSLGLAYLELVGSAPFLQDLHYEPKPGQTFKPYSVTGLLKRQTELRKFHLLPSLKTEGDYADLQFYYRTASYMPMIAVRLLFRTTKGQLSLVIATMDEYKTPVARTRKHN